ncbi:hypothetical protein HMPREF1986_00193, partial [Oribacterium sp. oral taxon 078 str. F0263]
YRKVSPPPTCEHVEEERLSDTGSIIMPFPEGGVKWSALCFSCMECLNLREISSIMQGDVSVYKLCQGSEKECEP